MIFTFTTSQFFLVLGFAIIIAVVASAAAMMPSRDYFKETRKRLDEADEEIKALKTHLFNLAEAFNDVSVATTCLIMETGINEGSLDSSNGKTLKKHGKKRKAHRRRK